MTTVRIEFPPEYPAQQELADKVWELSALPDGPLGFGSSAGRITAVVWSGLTPSTLRQMEEIGRIRHPEDWPDER